MYLIPIKSVTAFTYPVPDVPLILDGVYKLHDKFFIRAGFIYNIKIK
jgi:hypothetical protein